MSSIHDDVGATKPSCGLRKDGLQQGSTDDPCDWQTPLNCWVECVKLDIPAYVAKVIQLWNQLKAANFSSTCQMEFYSAERQIAIEERIVVHCDS